MDKADDLNSSHQCSCRSGGVGSFARSELRLRWWMQSLYGSNCQLWRYVWVRLRCKP